MVYPGDRGARCFQASAGDDRALDRIPASGFRQALGRCAAGRGDVRGGMVALRSQGAGGGVRRAEPVFRARGSVVEGGGDRVAPRGRADGDGNGATGGRERALGEAGVAKGPAECLRCRIRTRIRQGADAKHARRTLRGSGVAGERSTQTLARRPCRGFGRAARGCRWLDPAGARGATRPRRPCGGGEGQHRGDRSRDGGFFSRGAARGQLRLLGFPIRLRDRPEIGIERGRDQRLRGFSECEMGSLRWL